MKFLPVLLLALALIVPLHIQAASLDDANRAFAEGKFHDSTQAYQSVLDQKGFSAPVLFDLGNSYFREGNFPQAILAYKRALWLAPGDDDFRANLQAAQKQAGSPVDDVPHYAKFTSLLSASGWAWTACLSWTVLCLSLLLRAILPGQQVLYSLSGFVGALVLFAAIASMILSSADMHEAVVVDKDATALISPFPAAQSVFKPSPGDTVTVEKSYNDFLLVSDRAGHTGWMAKTQVAPVVPAG